MAKNEIAKSDKTMFPDMLKKSNFLISSVYRASLLENKVLALALTKVRGIGEKKAQKLLLHYKTILQMQKATPEELAKVAGVNLKIAQELYAVVQEISASSKA